MVMFCSNCWLFWNDVSVGEMTVHLNVRTVYKRDSGVSLTYYGRRDRNLIG